MADERIPLVKEDFRSVSQSESGRSCGCSYGPLTRICKKRVSEQLVQLLFSCCLANQLSFSKSLSTSLPPRAHSPPP